MSQFGEVETVFGKVGRADTGTDPAPYSMAETSSVCGRAPSGRGSRAMRWYSSWAPAPLQRLLRLGWPDETPRTTAELVEALDKAASLPGWTSAWTAPARARMDMMATGVRTPVGIRIDLARPGSAIEVLGGAVRGVAAPAGHAKRRLRIAGRRDLAVVRHRAGRAGPPRRRPGVGAATSSISDRDRRTARRGRGRRAGARCACASRPSSRPAPARPRRPAARDHGSRRGAIGRAGQPVPLGARRPSRLRAPARGAAHRARRARRLRLRRSRATGTDLQRYVERARREVDAAIATGNSASVRASASSGPASTGCSSRARGGSRGSSRSCCSRCSACCCCSSAASPRR